MGKYIKKFDTHSDYEDFTQTEDFIKPNVSYCIDNVEVHYNPIIAILIATYNVEDTSNPTPLFVDAESMGFPASAIYDKIEIDNVEIDMSDLSSLGEYYVYGFARSGQHTVKYTLKDPTMIGAELDEETGRPSNVGAMFADCPITSVEIPDSVTSIGYGAFMYCSSLTEVIISNNVTSIGRQAFDGCTGLTSVTIGNNVTSIGYYAFHDCVSLASVTIDATTPPTLDSNVFRSTNNCPIYVPSASVEAYKAATNWSAYASRIYEIGGIVK